MTLRDFTQDDLPYLIEHMREEDLQESKAWGYTDIKKAVEQSLGASFYTKTITTEDGKIMAVGGLVKKDHGNFRIWLLGTDHVDEHPIQFMRDIKEFIRENAHNALSWSVIIYKDQHRYLNFLRRLGFAFLPHNDRFFLGIKLF